MANGLRINVSKSEFIARPPEERDWMLFQALEKMNWEGCSFARRHYRKLYPIVGFGGFLGGAAVVLIRWIWG